MKYNLEQHGIGWRGNLFPSFKNGLTDGDVYQFGVWDGFSLQVLGALTNAIPMNHHNRFFGFDVFTGMPTEQNEPDKQRDDPGSFNLLRHYGVTNLEDALRLLQFDIMQNLNGNAELTLVQGLVEQSLTTELLEHSNLGKAFYVDFDMDIYSPTKYVFEFLVEHKIIVEGTIIGFDDWGQCFPEHDIYTFGESKAFKEVSDKYGIQTVKTVETDNHGQTAFLVTKIANF